ncbi:hypothetical protein CEQ15_14190 [Chryseobacterium indologenes]|uniref:hypothetical protein n=1 Tax=Chryseobacterium indologenes TaxID=253 RepID=UPI000B51DB2B|nr:hypothetical protein [Chryseobacterium indologenes]ASE62561.1 hypothetical protein CEQ15_14190 [Chryseobacterium indologenes]
MKKIFIKKYTRTKLNNLLGIDKSYDIPLYDNYENFKNDYITNLTEYLKHNPDDSENTFIGKNLIYKYDKYKAHPLEFKFTLSERKYGTFINVQFDISNLSSILREAINNYILGCYKRKTFLFPADMVQWDQVVTFKGNKGEVNYEKLTNDVLKILLKRMLNINSELLLIDFSRIFLQKYTYIERASIKFDYIGFINNEYIECHKIAQFLLKRVEELQNVQNKENTYKLKTKYSNPQKLALLQVLGFFELPIFKSLSETKINEITGIILGADPKEFVYKNRLNIKSKAPSYQIDKYTAFQYLDEMKSFINQSI